MSSFFPVSTRTGRRAALIWGLLLLALTSYPSPPEIPVVSWVPSFDKLCHGILYSVEGFFLYFAISWPGPSRPSFLLMRALTVGAALSVFGTLDEIHQAWIPGRSMEMADAVMDSVAGLVGGLAGSWVSVITPGALRRET